MAERQGRLAEAVLAWEVLTLLRPDDAEYRRRWLGARLAVDQAVTLRMARALAARQRGDALAAERLFLEALGFNPSLQAAAAALRDMEAERNRASVVGRFAQPPNLQARAGKAPPPQAPAPRGQTAPPLPAPVPAPGQRNLLEHASLLASQGELDAAIALLADSGPASLRDLDSRNLLVRLYLQRADQRASSDFKAARGDLERVVELDPTQTEAKMRLQTLPH